MANSIYAKIEEIAKNRQTAAIKKALQHWSIKIKIYKALNDVYANVYGKDTGSYASKYKAFNAVITNDDFFPAGLSASGTFQTGYMYIDSEYPDVGDKIEVIRGDGKSHNFKITSKEGIGMSTEIMYRYKLSSVSE